MEGGFGLSGLPDWSQLQGKPFVTVTPNGPSDGGDFGPNTVGTKTAGIQEAVNALLPTGGTVFIRRNQNPYTISASIVLSSDITLMGEGKLATLIKLAGSVNVDAISGVGPAGPTSTAMMRVVVRDLGLDGNKANNSSGNGMTFKNILYLTVENCLVQNFAGKGVYDDNTGITGVFGNSTQTYTHLNRIVVTTCNGDGISVQTNTKVTIFECESVVGGNGMNLNNITQSQVIANYIHNCVLHGMILGGVTFSLVAFNDIEACGTASNNDNGMYVSGAGGELAIIGNLITGNFNGLYSDNGIGDQTGILIAFNLVISNSNNGMNLNNNSIAEPVLVLYNITRGNGRTDFTTSVLLAKSPNLILVGNASYVSQRERVFVPKW